MNNHGVARYLGQQNVVQRFVVNRVPGQQQIPVQPRQPALVAPAAYSYQPNTYPPPHLVPTAPQGVVPYAPRPRLSYPPAITSLQFITPAAPAPAPVGTVSVTVASSDSEYLQYSDPVIDDYHYNQQQILSVDNNNYAQYEKQTYQQSQTYGQAVHIPLQ